MGALVFEEFLSTPEMLDVFGPPSFVQAMLDFEAALAAAQAAHGLIPQAAAAAIAAACDAQRLDVPALVAASGRAGSLAIPFVEQLTGVVARDDAEARCPTLVIAGSADAGTPVEMSQAIVERIPGAELRVIDGAAHLGAAEQPQAFSSRVVRFIEALPG